MKPRRVKTKRPTAYASAAIRVRWSPETAIRWESPRRASASRASGERPERSPSDKAARSPPPGPAARRRCEASARTRSRLPESGAAFDASISTCRAGWTRCPTAPIPLRARDRVRSRLPGFWSARGGLSRTRARIRSPARWDSKAGSEAGVRGPWIRTPEGRDGPAASRLRTRRSSTHIQSTCRATLATRPSMVASTAPPAGAKLAASSLASSATAPAQKATTIAQAARSRGNALPRVRGRERAPPAGVRSPIESRLDRRGGSPRPGQWRAAEADGPVDAPGTGRRPSLVESASLVKRAALRHGPVRGLPPHSRDIGCQRPERFVELAKLPEKPLIRRCTSSRSRAVFLNPSSPLRWMPYAIATPESTAS